MPETLGSLCDKLTTVKLKLWHADDPQRLASLAEQEKQLLQETNELIRSAISGRALLVVSRDVRGIAEAIRKLIEQPELAQGLVSRAQGRAREGLGCGSFSRFSLFWMTFEHVRRCWKST